MYKNLTLLLILFEVQLIASQEKSTHFEKYIAPEFMYGIMGEPNHDFPKTKPEKALFISFGTYQQKNKHEWAYRLNYPTTGISLGVADFGNSKYVGQAFSILPYIEFDFIKFQKKSIRAHTSLGLSYFNKKYDPVHNPLNRGVSQNLNWAFNLFVYYPILETKRLSWKLGMGYFHQSNGHSQLPNQGINSFLLSASAEIKYKPEATDSLYQPTFTKSRQTYFSLRTGIGQNVLSEKYNDLKEVYTVALSAGRIINKTIKLGGGIYYRFYKHYYDYIKNKEPIVAKEYPHFQESPGLYASNLGIFGTAELLLNHVGIEFQVGLNIYKPAYKIDWKLNQGYSYVKNTDNGPEKVEVQGVLDWYYEVKRSISSRLGLKYYLFSTSKYNKYNVFIGAAINANLGQADFNDLSLGVIYTFDSL